MLTVLSLSLAGGAGAGVMFDTGSAQATAQILYSGGWTLLTGVCLMLFSLVHNPCSTTIYTIYKETGSIKWTVISSILPVIMGFLICFFVAQIWRIFF
jgi:ferrous iron transport protein B